MSVNWNTTTAEAAMTRDIEIKASVRGMDLIFTDEASTFEGHSPSGWIMFCEMQGEHLTSNEIREVADEMDRQARISGREARHDI